MKKTTLLAAATLLPSIAGAAEQSTASPDLVANGFLMICASLVILMSIPGIALFYGGMVRAKNILSILVQTVVTFSLMYFLWTIFGYSLAMSSDGDSWIHLFYGDLSRLFLLNINPATVDSHQVSELYYFAFQGAFAAITGCLILGAFAERIKFAGLLIVLMVWFPLAYLPSWHMVWGGGWLDQAFGVLDFAGGTVVHINASICGLVGAYFIGKRLGYGREAMAPHSLTITMIGTCLLWFGWFGFNAGSQLTPDGISALAFVNTIVAPSVAALSWMGFEWVFFGKPSMLGACSGAIAGLVAITPACGFVGPLGGIIIGLVAGGACLWGVHGLKKLLHVDDTLDVFGIHGLGGIIGAILTGVFASPSLGGMGFGGDNTCIMDQVIGQSVSVLVTIVWTGVISLIGFNLAKFTTGIRVSREDERQGLDLSSHGERAYTH